MILQRIEFKGLTRFDGQPVGFDLDRLGPGLIALVGKNGEGKTTALEAVFAALYKALPSYDAGTIYNQVRGRDAFVRATFVDDQGREVVAKVKLDGERRAAECILSIDGKPVTTGKGKDFDEKVEQLFGSPAMVLASVFAAQNKAGNFLFMRKGERKELFAELLGLARTVALAEQARVRLAAVERDRAAAQAAVRAIGYDGAAHDQARADLARLADDVAAGTGLLDSLNDDLARARERAAGAGTALAELQAADAAARQAQTTVDAAKTAYEAEGSRIEAERGRLAARIAHLKVAAAIPDEVRAEAAKDLDALQDDQMVSTQTKDQALARLRRAGDLREQLRERDARVAGVRAAAGTSRARIEAQLDALRQQAEPLDQAPCAVWTEWFPPGAPTSADDAPVDLAGTCPLLAAARGARERIAPGETQLQKIDADEAGALYDADDPDERAAIERELSEIDEAAEQQRVDAYLRDIANCEALIRGIEQARGRVAAVAGHQAALDQARDDLRQVEADAEQRLAQLRAARADAVARLGAANNRCEQASAAYAEQQDATQALTDAEFALQRASATHADVQQRHAAQVERVRALDEKQAAAAAALATEQAAVGEQVDWQQLADALGKDGIQALEIDAAGPTVSALVNDLLASCYGPRFSVRLDTLREKRDGTLAEDFELHVYDDGQERAAWQFSGGQKVIVGEALGLALAIFNANRFGVRWGTLFRDETAGALDPEAAAAYVLMLRRAMAIGGFRNVVFVSHVEAVWEAADAIVRVEGGRIEEGREALPT